MKVFILSVAAVAVIGIGCEILLPRFAGESSEAAYSTTATRL